MARTLTTGTSRSLRDQDRRRRRPPARHQRRRVMTANPTPLVGGHAPAASSRTRMVVRHWTGGNSADLLDRIMDSVETEAPAEGIRVRSESARRSFLGGAVDLAELDSLLVVTNGV